MDKELRTAAEFAKGKVYLVFLRGTPKDTPQQHFFCIDTQLVYEPFFSDFGPLNLGNLYRFCQMLNSKLQDPVISKKKIYFYAGLTRQAQANAAYLMSSYAVMYLNMSPDEAHAILANNFTPFMPFRDAAFGQPTHDLTIMHCLRAIEKARALGWLDFTNFNLEEYEYYERVENGDLNWVVPGKFIAFSGPHDEPTIQQGIRLLTPEDYVPFFRKAGVTNIIRLNKKVYKKQKFTNAGFKHHELYYLDGSNPPMPILRRFLEICESEPGVVAVHCKAGLGRTGTCIGAYMIKHFGLSADETIAWLRICRPGSVIGPQQHFLQEMQARLVAQGQMHRKRMNIPEPLPSSGMAPSSPDAQEIDSSATNSPGSVDPESSESSPEQAERRDTRLDDSLFTGMRQLGLESSPPPARTTTTTTSSVTAKATSPVRRSTMGDPRDPYLLRSGGTASRLTSSPLNSPIKVAKDEAAGKSQGDMLRLARLSNAHSRSAGSTPTRTPTGASASGGGYSASPSAIGGGAGATDSPPLRATIPGSRFSTAAPESPLGYSDYLGYRSTTGSAAATGTRSPSTGAAGVGARSSVRESVDLDRMRARQVERESYTTLSGRTSVDSAAADVRRSSRLARPLSQQRDYGRDTTSSPIGRSSTIGTGSYRASTLGRSTSALGTASPTRTTTSSTLEQARERRAGVTSGRTSRLMSSHDDYYDSHYRR